MRVALLSVCTLILATSTTSIEVQQKTPSDLFRETAISGKISSGRFVPLQPHEVEEVIKRGTVAIEELRQLAVSGNQNQKFWAVFCIGGMSKQTHDLQFLTTLNSDNDWQTKLGQSNKRIWINQVLLQSIELLNASTDASQ